MLFKTCTPTKAADLKRAVQSMDDCEFIGAEFMKLQANVINLTQLTKTFFDKLVSQLEEGLDNIDEQYHAQPAAAAAANANDS